MFRDVRFLPRKAADLVWKQSKGETCVSVNKADRTRKSEEYFDIKHGDAEIEVCPASFWSSFGLVFPHYALFPPFWNGDVYSGQLYVGNV